MTDNETRMRTLFWFCGALFLLSTALYVWSLIAFNLHDFFHSF